MENKDVEIPDMQLNIDSTQRTTNLPNCMIIHELQQAMSQDEHLHHLKDHIIQGWPESRDQVPSDMRTYWMFKDYMAVIDGVKGRCMVIPELLQRQALQ